MRFPLNNYLAAAGHIVLVWLLKGACIGAGFWLAWRCLNAN